MIKYRPQRGTLEESVSLCKEFVDVADMLKYITEEAKGPDGKPFYKINDIVIGESHGEDKRIGWKSWRYVCTVHYGKEDYTKTRELMPCIGICDFGEAE